MLCFSVDSKDSLENVESKWVGEIAENCAGVKLVLVALKCDLREAGGDDEEDEAQEVAAATGEMGAGKNERGGMIDYKMGLEVAKRIQALRYLGMLLPNSSIMDAGGCLGARMLTHGAQNVQRNETAASTKPSLKLRASPFQ